MNDSDAPSYKKQSANQLKRKQDAVKAIITEFNGDSNKYGGGVEEDWSRHIDEFETVALDYQLKSKDMAYYLRLTLKDHTLSVHRSQYPAKVKTNPKLCKILKLRFDTRTKKDTNSKALHRLTFEPFLTSACGSPLCAFSALVLRMEKLASIAQPKDQTERAKVTFLMRAIETTSWYIQATEGVENLTNFSEVVQKVNHELAKQAHNNPQFDQQGYGRLPNDLRHRSKGQESEVNHGVLYGSEEGEAHQEEK